METHLLHCYSRSLLRTAISEGINFGTAPTCIFVARLELEDIVSFTAPCLETKAAIARVGATNKLNIHFQMKQFIHAALWLKPLVGKRQESWKPLDTRCPSDNR